MSFLYPLGFLGLIAVPILIIIYIIKNKYTEQVISATYIWTLSERFLKRKNPINKLTGIISLILQILAVVFISVAIAHPVFVLPNAAGDFCFVLDASGSMNITQSGVTRFDKGKERINSLITESADGSKYTLICVGTVTNVIFEDIGDKEQALSLVADIDPAYVSSGVTDAISVAQEYFDANADIKTYLITDKAYETSDNVELVDVSAHESNFALSDVGYSYSEGKVHVSGKAISYEEDAENVNVKLYLDGEAAGEQVLKLNRLEFVDFKFETQAADFSELRVEIAEEDALLLDNEFVIYNEKSDSSFRTLIVSSGSPFYVQSTLISLGNNQVATMKVEEYEAANTEGYGLYIFDGYSPAVMPRDGAVWFFNPLKSTENSGFSVQGDIIEEVGKIEYSTSSSTRVRNLLKGLVRDDVYISGYMKCGLYRNFTTVASIKGNPLVFAGTNSYGNREVVFAFDLQRSDLVMSFDFIPLVRNLLNYTFPEVVENQSAYCGETIQVNVLANCDSIRVDTPLGKIEYLDTGTDLVEYGLTEVGVYTLTLMFGNMPRVVNLFSAMPEEERATTVAAETAFVINGEAGGGMRDGVYDNLLIMFIVLAVLILADWVVYCYEQYQL